MSELIIDRYLKAMTKQGASDLFLTKGASPSLRIDGKVIPIKAPPLKEEDINLILEDLLNEDQRDELESTLELNTAIDYETGERFRISVFYQKGQHGLVARLIKTEIPSFEDLGIPDVYGDFIMDKRGLFLMVGSTGSGKSTSLASMLDYRNKNGSGHIITIEDPIEFLHEHKNCIFTQREVGMDTYSYSIALKNALRQSPDVVLIGEIRDRETMENAILFCETGHLVIATLHANNSNQAIERIINMFPEELHRQILTTLSQNINAVVSQRLVPSVDGKLAMAYEILINTGLARVLISEGKVKELKDVMERNYGNGMITFDQCLLDMIKAEKISLDVALEESDNPNNLKLKIKQDPKLRGVEIKEMREELDAEISIKDDNEF